MGPLVSVVIPAFNAERTLRETLESAAAQSWRSIEIIIVDDGSIDRTGEIARQFCAAEPRARLVRQPNSGVAAARNRAIAEAAGNWIATLDSDDLWHPEKIERQLAASRGDPGIGLVYCWSRHIDASGRVIGTAPIARFEGDVLRDHLGFNFVGNGSTPLIRRDLLQGLQYNSQIDACADYLLQLQLAMRTQFALAPAYLTAYRISGTNMSSDAVRMIREHIALYRLLLPQLHGLNRRIAAREMARCRVNHGLVLLRRGTIIPGIGSLMSGLLRAPAVAVSQASRQIRLRGRKNRVGWEQDRQPRLFADFEPTEQLS